MVIRHFCSCKVLIIRCKMKISNSQFLHADEKKKNFRFQNCQFSQRGFGFYPAVLFFVVFHFCTFLPYQLFMDSTLLDLFHLPFGWFTFNWTWTCVCVYWERERERIGVLVFFFSINCMTLVVYLFHSFIQLWILCNEVFVFELSNFFFVGPVRCYKFNSMKRVNTKLLLFLLLQFHAVHLYSHYFYRVWFRLHESYYV